MDETGHPGQGRSPLGFSMFVGEHDGATGARSHPRNTERVH